MKKFCGRSLEKSRDQIFQKNRFFVENSFFIYLFSGHVLQQHGAEMPGCTAVHLPQLA